MNVHELGFFDVQQQANSTFRLENVRQLLLHVNVLEADQQWANDDDLKFGGLAPLNEVTIELVVVDFDM